MSFEALKSPRTFSKVIWYGLAALLYLVLWSLPAHAADVYDYTDATLNDYGGGNGVPVMGTPTAGFQGPTGALETFTMSTAMADAWANGQPAYMCAYDGSEYYISDDYWTLPNYGAAKESRTWHWTDGPEVSTLTRFVGGQDAGCSSNVDWLVPYATGKHLNWSFAYPNYNFNLGVIALITAADPAPSIAWNGPSPVADDVPLAYGYYVASASATASSFTPSAMTIQAVNIDHLYQPHLTWSCSPLSASLTCDTESFVPKVLGPGTWRFLAVSPDGSGGVVLSETRDVVVPESAPGGTPPPSPVAPAADQWLAVSSGTGTASSPPGAWVTSTYSPADLSGQITWSASNAEILRQGMSGWVVGQDGLLCPDDGSGTSTVCGSLNQASGLLSYPLLSWPIGIYQSFSDAWESASTTGATPLTVSIPAFTTSRAPSFSTSEVTILSSASSTAGVGRWISQSNFAWFRVMMTGGLWLAFVLSIARKWNDLVVILHGKN